MRAVPGFVLLFGLFVAVAVVIAARGDSADAVDSGQPTRGIFLAVDAPDLTDEELALLAELARVDSFDALQSALTDQTSLLAIDASAMAHIPDGFLADQLLEGRAIMGINVFGDVLSTAAGFPNRDWPTQEQWAQTHDGHGEGAFYSYVYRSPPGRPVQQSGGGQHHFKDRLFPAVLEQLLDGAWRE